MPKTIYTCKQCSKAISGWVYRPRTFCSRSCKGKFFGPPKNRIQYRGGGPRGVSRTQEFKDSLSRYQRSNLKSREHYRKIGLLGLKKLSERKETSIETAVYTALKDLGIVFERQKVINNRFLVDAYIPSLNLVIECDGKYWHSLDRVVEKDKKENAYLSKCGYSVIRLSEEEIVTGEFRDRLEVLS